MMEAMIKEMVLGWERWIKLQYGMTHLTSECWLVFWLFCMTNPSSYQVEVDEDEYLYLCHLIRDLDGVPVWSQSSD